MPSLHLKALVAAGISFGLLVGCSGRVPPPPPPPPPRDDTTRPATLPSRSLPGGQVGVAAEPYPAAWDMREMTSAAVAHAPRDDGGPLRPLAARVIRWRVTQSDSSKVDEAVIEIEAEGGNWRLAHIYRFSDERHGWRPSIIWDAGDEYAYFRDYHSQPSGPALESFLRASKWGDVNGFRIIAGDRR